jgi:hypothetical protein
MQTISKVRYSTEFTEGSEVPEKYTLEVEEVSVVVLGSFNPTIFQPLWFSANGLLPSNESENAQIQIVHSEVTNFISGDWLKVEVTQNRFLVSTGDPSRANELRDLALGTFQILEHTPLEKLGFNRNIHYRIDNEELWHAFGDRYAPKDTWGNIFDGADYRVGLVNLTIAGKRADAGATRVQFNISPSTVIKPGVFVRINQHYELGGEDSTHQERFEKFKQVLGHESESFLTFTSGACKKLFDDAFGNN